MKSREQELEETLERLRSWSSSLAEETKSALPQIRKAALSKSKSFPNSPSRGSEAEMCARGIHKKLVEVQGALRDLEELLLSPDAPWST